MFAVHRNAAEITRITSAEMPAGRLAVEARLGDDGTMTLTVGGAVSATGNARLRRKAASFDGKDKSHEKRPVDRHGSERRRFAVRGRRLVAVSWADRRGAHERDTSASDLE